MTTPIRSRPAIQVEETHAVNMVNTENTENTVDTENTADTADTENTENTESPVSPVSNIESQTSTLGESSVVNRQSITYGCVLTD